MCNLYVGSWCTRSLSSPAKLFKSNRNSIWHNICGGEAVGCGEVGNYLHVSVLKPFNQCCMASAKQVTKSPNDIAHLIQGLFIFTYWRYESHNYASHARGRETDSSLPKQKLCAHNPESAGPERTNTAKTLVTVEHAVPKTKKREKKVHPLRAAGLCWTGNFQTNE